LGEKGNQLDQQCDQLDQKLHQLGKKDQLDQKLYQLGETWDDLDLKLTT